VGDILRVTTPSGLLELPLAAIVEAAFVSPAGDAIVSRSILRRHWPDAQVRHVYVLVKQGASLAAVRSEISKRVGERYGLQVMSSDDLGRFYAQTVRRGFSFLDALGWLTLVVVLLGTGDALAAEVLERGRELGTMRAVGASRRHVAAIVLGQALSVGIVGGALGLPVGFALSYAYVTGVVPGTLGWQLAYEPELSSALAATGLGLFACLLGSIVPALRATRLPPLAALRYE
jgi:putative ABC transport system permease protein